MSTSRPLAADTGARGAEQAPLFRRAGRRDVAALAELEQRCFSQDRLNARSFQRFIRSDSAYLVLAESAGTAGSPATLLGYSLLLFHRGTSLARLYSIAVAPEARGRQLAEQLLAHCEQAAAELGKVFMRLEVHPQNHTAIRLYERLGYRRFGVYRDYYEDHSDALRLQKRILYYRHPGHTVSVPYYAQTTEFSCGPAALMMALAALDPEYHPDRREELRIWREATTIYMTSGHGGCGPHGLALAAWRRGLDATIYISQEGPLFLEGVRREEKKSVLRQVHEDYLAELADTDVALHHVPIELDTLRAALNSGHVPLVLISTYSFNRNKAPHWVVVAAMDDRFVYIHDPEIDPDIDRDALDNQYLPITLAAFNKSMRFGRDRLRCALLIKQREQPVPDQPQPPRP